MVHQTRKRADRARVEAAVFQELVHAHKHGLRHGHRGFVDQPDLDRLLEQHYSVSLFDCVKKLTYEQVELAVLVITRYLAVAHAAAVDDGGEAQLYR